MDESLMLHICSEKLFQISEKFKFLKSLVEKSDCNDNEINHEKLKLFQINCSKYARIHCEDSIDSSKLYYISLSPFSSLKELYINYCPPSSFEDLFGIRLQLEILEITYSGIPELLKLFLPNFDESDSFNQEVLNTLKPMTLAMPIKRPVNHECYLWRKLKRLVLRHCGISNMDHTFHFFFELEYLDISHNDITHIVHLQDCTFLSYLNISNNRVSVLSNISLVLGNITVLDLSHNSIESLDGINKVLALISIDVSYNKIDDYNEIDYLRQLPNIEVIELHHNPLSNQKEYRYLVFYQLLHDYGYSQSTKPIPILDGKEMTSKEKKKLQSYLFRAPIDKQRDITRKDDDYIFPINTDKNETEELSDGAETERFSESLRYSISSNQSTSAKKTNPENSPPRNSESNLQLPTKLTKQNHSPSRNRYYSQLDISNFRRDPDRLNYLLSINPVKQSYSSSIAGNSNVNPFPIVPEITDESSETASAPVSLMRQQSQRSYVIDNNGSSRDSLLSTSDGSSYSRRNTQHFVSGRKSQLAAKSIGVKTTSVSKINENYEYYDHVRQTKKDVDEDYEQVTVKYHKPTFFTKQSQIDLVDVVGDFSENFVGICTCGVPIENWSVFTCSPKTSRVDDSGFTSNPMMKTKKKETICAAKTTTIKNFANLKSLLLSLNSETDEYDYLVKLQGILHETPLPFPEISTADDLLTYNRRLMEAEVKAEASLMTCVQSYTSDTDLALSTSAGKSSDCLGVSDDVPPAKSLVAVLAMIGSKAAKTTSSSEARTEASASSTSATAATESTAISSVPRAAAKAAKATVLAAKTVIASGSSNIMSKLRPKRSSDDNTNYEEILTLTAKTPSSVNFSNKPNISDKPTLGEQLTNIATLSRLPKASSGISSKATYITTNASDNTPNDHVVDAISHTCWDCAATDSSSINDIAVGEHDDIIEATKQTYVTSFVPPLSTPKKHTAASVPTQNETQNENGNDFGHNQAEADQHNIQHLLSTLLNSDSPIDNKSSYSQIRSSVQSAKVQSELSPSSRIHCIDMPSGRSPVDDSHENVNHLVSPTASFYSRHIRRSIYQEVEQSKSTYRPLLYVGEKEYNGLNVAQNLVLYFKEQVFSPRWQHEGPYLLKDNHRTLNADNTPNHTPQAIEPKYITSKLKAFPVARFVSVTTEDEKFVSCHIVKGIDMSAELIDLLATRATGTTQSYGGYRQSRQSSDHDNDHVETRSVTHSVRFQSVDLDEYPLMEVSALHATGDKYYDESNINIPPSSPASSSQPRMTSQLSTSSKTASSTIANNTSVNSTSSTPQSSNHRRVYNYSISAQMSDEQPILEDDYILVITDCSLYIMQQSSLPPTATFEDAPVPELFRAHPLRELSATSIFFGFQRCIFYFSKLPSNGSNTDDENDVFSPYPHSTEILTPNSSPIAKIAITKLFNNTNSSNLNISADIDMKYSYAYVVITRDKSSMNPIISSITSLAKKAKLLMDESAIVNNSTKFRIGPPTSICSKPSAVDLPATLPSPASSSSKQQFYIIENKDAQLLHQVNKACTPKNMNTDIVHYQMLYQYWRKRPEVYVPRSVVATSSGLLLCYEELLSREVELLVLDVITFKSIQSLKVEKANHGMLTIVIRESGIFSKSRKWRLFIDNANIATKLSAVIKKLCLETGNFIT